MPRAPEDTDPRGENSPPPGLRPRRRGHFRDAPWHPPGKRTEARLSGAHACQARLNGTRGRPVGSEIRSLEIRCRMDGTVDPRGDLPVARQVSRPGVPEGQGRGRLIFRANSGISLGNPGR